MVYFEMFWCMVQQTFANKLLFLLGKSNLCTFDLKCLEEENLCPPPILDLLFHIKLMQLWAIIDAFVTKSNILQFDLKKVDLGRNDFKLSCNPV
jgi:hypothetical protein